MIASIRLLMFRVLRALSIYIVSPIEYNWFKVFKEQKKLGLEINRQINLSVIRFDLNGSSLKPKFRSNSSDIAVFRQIFILNEYMPAIQILQSVGKVVKNMVDAGANVGFTSLQVAAFFPEVKILAIEADPENYQWLKQNLETHFPNRTTALNRALWSTNEALTFENSNNTNYWARKMTPSASQGVNSIIGYSAKDMLDYYGAETIDFLKIDIEGAETEFFKDKETSLELLKNTRLMAIELHGNEVFERVLKDLLVLAGFFYFHSSESIIAYNKHIYSNKP